MKQAAMEKKKRLTDCCWGVPGEETEESVGELVLGCRLGSLDEAPESRPLPVVLSAPGSNSDFSVPPNCSAPSIHLLS